MKRVVRLRDKKTREISTYPTVSDLIERFGEEALGITRAALYNALHNGLGYWENAQFQVYYENIELGNSIWK